MSNLNPPPQFPDPQFFNPNRPEPLPEQATSNALPRFAPPGSHPGQIFEFSSPEEQARHLSRPPTRSVQRADPIDAELRDLRSRRSDLSKIHRGSTGRTKAFLEGAGRDLLDTMDGRPVIEWDPDTGVFRDFDSPDIELREDELGRTSGIRSHILSLEKRSQERSGIPLFRERTADAIEAERAIPGLLARERALKDEYQRHLSEELKWRGYLDQLDQREEELLRVRHGVPQFAPGAGLGDPHTLEGDLQGQVMLAEEGEQAATVLPAQQQIVESPAADRSKKFLKKSEEFIDAEVTADKASAGKLADEALAKAIEASPTPEPPTIAQNIQHIAGQVLRGGMEMLADAPKIPVMAWETLFEKTLWAAGLLGMDAEKMESKLQEWGMRQEDPEEYFLWKLGSEMQQMPGEWFPGHEGLEEAFWRTEVSRGVGSMVGFLLLGYLTRGRSMAAQKAGFVNRFKGFLKNPITHFAGSQQATRAFEDALEHGADTNTAASAAIANYGGGMLQVANVFHLVHRFDRLTQGKLSQSLIRSAKTVAVSGANEWLVEAGGQAWFNTAALALYDEDRSFWEDVIPSGNVGGASGVVSTILMEGVAAAVSKRGVARRRMSPEETRAVASVKTMTEVGVENFETMPESERESLINVNQEAVSAAVAEGRDPLADIAKHESHEEQSDVPAGEAATDGAQSDGTETGQSSEAIQDVVGDESESGPGMGMRVYQFDAVDEANPDTPARMSITAESLQDALEQSRGQGLSPILNTITERRLTEAEQNELNQTTGEADAPPVDTQGTQEQASVEQVSQEEVSPQQQAETPPSSAATQPVKVKALGESADAYIERQGAKSERQRDTLRKSHRNRVLKAVVEGESVSAEAVESHRDVATAAQIKEEFGTSPAATQAIARLFQIVEREAPGKVSVEVVTQSQMPEGFTERGAMIEAGQDGTFSIFLNRDAASNVGDGVGNSIGHETAHVFGQAMDSFVRTEWQSLSPEQRRRAAQEYDATGEHFGGLDDAGLADSFAARQEWFAFQFHRVATGQVDGPGLLAQGYSKSFVDRLVAAVKEFRELIRDWVGDASLSTAALQQRISEILGEYQPDTPLVSSRPPAKKRAARKRAPVKKDVAPTQSSDTNKLIGRNAKGHSVYEDGAGVRSYSESGVLVSEPVEIVPGKGVVINPDQRRADFKTLEETGGESGQLSAAEKELGDALEGLFTPQNQTAALEQKGIPVSNLPKLLPIVEKLIGEGKTSPRDVVEILDRIADSQGKAKSGRVLADAVYSIFRMVDPSLPPTGDWTTVFSEVDGAGQSESASVDSDRSPSDGAEFIVRTPATNSPRLTGTWSVVESDQVLTSLDDGYNQSLQPRDRSRRASEEQIQRIAQNIDPERMGSSLTSDMGAPIVDENGMVLSGNGRTQSIRAAYGQYPQSAERYRQWIIDNAGLFGIDPSRIKSMSTPVLVRRIDDFGDVSKETFAEESNRSQLLGTSMAEQAAQDAKIIADNAVLAGKFMPSESGDIMAASNREFLNEFIELTGDSAELINAKGDGYSPVLESRLKRALIAAAVGPENMDVIIPLTEETEGLRRVANAVAQVAPRLVQLRGTPFDLQPHLAQALKDYVTVVREGSSVETLLSQQTLFDGRGNTEYSDTILGILGEYGTKSAKRIAEYLESYTDSALKQDTTTGEMDLGLDAVTPGTILSSVEGTQSGQNESDQHEIDFQKRSLGELETERPQGQVASRGVEKDSPEVQGLSDDSRRSDTRSTRPDADSDDRGAGAGGDVSQVRGEGLSERGDAESPSRQRDGRRVRDSRGREAGDSTGDVLAQDEGADTQRSGQGAAADGSVSRRGRVRVSGADQRGSASELGQNYRIGVSDSPAPRGDRGKLEANIDAIKLLRTLQEEGRRATPAEQAVLARYTGWGWTGNRLNENHKDFDRWGKPIKDLLSEAEWDSAKSSTINAHYTSPEIIRAMWSMAERLGFTGGNILEPAGGIGHFFGAMPDSIADGSSLTGVELDSISAGIFEQLYPRADIRHKGYEETSLPNNYFDLAISNVPFGGYKITAKDFSGHLIHDYFFLRSLNKVRPGGLVMFVTSNGTLDKGNQAVRQMIADRADLVAAVRLPNDAFMENAGTEVTTDIIVLRKKDGTPFQGEAFLNISEIGSATVDGESSPIMVNEYFANHPEMALGKHSLEGSMYRSDSYALKSDRRDIGSALKAAIESIPENIFDEQSASRPTETIAGAGMKESEVVLRDGELFEVSDGRLVVPEWLRIHAKGDPDKPSYNKKITEKEKANRARIARRWLKLKEGVRDLLEAEITPDVTEKTLDTKRKYLNMLYNEYVKKDGTLNDDRQQYEKAWFLRDDPDYPLVQSIESQTDTLMLTAAGQPNKQGRFAYEKGPIFTQRLREPKRVPESAQDIDEAINISLGWEGRVDVPFAAKLLGVEEGQVEKSIAESGRAFRNPETGLWDISEKYLSGNVRKKLAAAIEAAESDPALKPNVEALERVQPQEIPIEDVHVTLGSSWIPTGAYEQFIQDTLKTQARVKYTPEINKWNVAIANHRTPENTVEFGTEAISGDKLIENALNFRESIVKYKDADGKVHVDKNKTAEAAVKSALLRDKFVDWVKTSEAKIASPEGSDGRKRSVQSVLTDLYNQTNNAIVAPNYTGDYMTFPGLAFFKPHPHQKAAAARVVQEGSVLLAHGVGSGKTLSLIMSAMEMKRLGLAQKPLIVVQKATIGQFAATFRQAYPDANILVANEKSFSKRFRRRFLNQIATGNYDAVVITQPQFTSFNSSPEKVRTYLQNKIGELESALSSAKQDGLKKSDPTVKQLETAKNNLEAKLKDTLEKIEKRTDDVWPFDKSGVDALLIDEAHAYKNAQIVTNMARVKGVPNTVSERAMDTEIKTNHIHAVNGGRNVIFATGTPITNTMAEAYVMLRFTHPRLLEEYGIKNFDNFANTFGTIVSQVEWGYDGRMKRVQRFAKFVNGPELILMIRSAMDVKMGNEELGLKVPKINGGTPQAVIVEQTPAMQQAQDFLNRVIESYEAQTDKREFSWVPIVTMQAGMAAALDPRLLDPSLPDDPGSKINTAIEKVKEVYDKTTERKGAQIVFADRFFPMSSNKLESLVGGNAADVTLSVENEILADAEASDVGNASNKESADEKKVDVDASFSRQRWNVYSEIKEKLVRMGIPEAEVAIVHEARNDDQREALFNRVQTGDVRVLIGSTERLGVGVNVQKRLAAVHHLDPPRSMTPAMMEQRNGRIIRQGNDFENVDIFNYGVSQSMDTGIYQMLETKQKFIVQLLKGEGVGRDFNDPSDEVSLSMAQMKAQLTGDPRIMRFVELDGEVKDLRSERDGFNSGISRLRRRADQIATEQEMIEKQSLPRTIRTEELLQKNVTGDRWTLEIDGKKLTDRAAIVETLDSLWDSLTEDAKGPSSSARRVILNGVGMELRASWRESTLRKTTRMMNPVDPNIVLRESSAGTGSGVLSALTTVAKNFPDVVTNYKKRLESLEAEAKSVNAELKKTFPKVEELRKKEKELNDLETQLAEKEKPELGSPPVRTHEALFAPRNAPMSPEIQAIHDRVNTDLVDRRTIWKRVQDAFEEKTENARRRFVQAGVDNLSGIRYAMDDQLGKGSADSIDGRLNPLKHAHLTRELRILFQSWMTDGTFRYENGDIVRNDGSSGLAASLEKLVDGEGHSLVPMWETYVTAFRSDRLLKEGREQNFGFDSTGYRKAIAAGKDVSRADFWNQERAQQEIDNVLSLAKEHPVLEQVRQEYVKWNKALLDFAEAAGVINAQSRKTWEKADYIPFYRVSEAAEVAKEIIGISKSKDPKKEAKLIRRLTGGSGKIAVLENIAKNFDAMMSESMINSTKQKIVQVMGTSSGLLEKVPYKAVPFKSTKDEAITVMAAQRYVQLKESGELPPAFGDQQKFINAVKSQVAAGNLEMLGVQSQADLDNQIMFWRMKRPVGEDIMTVMVDGKPTFYKVHDPMLLESINAIGPDVYAGVMRKFLAPFGAAKRFLTEAITLEPSFIIANGVRETVWSWAASEKLLVPGIGTAKGTVEMWNKDGLGGKLGGVGLGGGAAWGGFRNDPLMPKNARAAILSMSGHDRKGFLGTLVNTPKKAFDLYRNLVETSEYANRYGLAKEIVDSGGSHIEAAFQAKDLTNFTAHGGHAFARALIFTVPFLNARLQGLHKLARSPGGLSSKAARRQLAAFTIKAALVTSATIALLARNWDNDDYWSLPDWDRDAYYHLWVMGQHFRIPKPFEVGAVFSTIPERMVTGIGRKDDMKDVMGSYLRIFSETFALNPAPQGVKQFVEQGFNQNFFTGAPIENFGDQFLLPEQRFGDFTSDTFKEIAQALPDGSHDWLKSPKRLEAFYRGMTGTLGSYALDMSDIVVRNATDAPEKPESHWRDAPIMRNVVGRFWRSPDPKSSRYVGDFYELYQETEKIVRRIDLARQQGDMERARRLQQENIELVRAKPRLDTARQRLGDIRRRQSAIRQSDLPPAEKRQRLNELTEMRNELARRSLYPNP